MVKFVNRVGATVRYVRQDSLLCTTKLHCILLYNQNSMVTVPINPRTGMQPFPQQVYCGLGDLPVYLKVGFKYSHQRQNGYAPVLPLTGIFVNPLLGRRESLFPSTLKVGLQIIPQRQNGYAAISTAGVLRVRRLTRLPKSGFKIFPSKAERVCTHFHSRCTAG